MIAPAEFATLTLEWHGAVALVTLRRAAQLNAMNRQMQAEITAVFEALATDADTRCIVVTGEGRGFMAGADIKEYAAQTDAEFDAFQLAGARMYAAIEDNPRPVIAAVNGHALGGGFELVLCCDLVIAAATAKLGLPEIKLGLVPGGGGTQRSVAKLGRNFANRLLMTGAILLAEAFEASGLIGEIVAPEKVLARALAVAAEVAAEPPDAIAGLKRLTAHAAQDDRAAGLAAERELVWGQERVQAFAARSAAKRAAAP